MKLISVNVSLPKEVSYQGKTVKTSICKEPVAGRVMVRRRNVDGDDQADRRVHGVGFEMAVYVYPVQHYAFWETELGREAFPYGQFGENFTVEGLSEDAVRVGDIFRVGGVGGALLQVTQPRIPCYKLAMRMAEGPDFPARFQETGRMGFYCRVLEEGEVGAGDSLEFVERAEDSVTIADFIRVYLHESHDPASLNRVLASRGLGDAWKVYLEKMLKKAEPVVSARGWEGFRSFLVDHRVQESETITSFYLKPQDGEPLPTYLPGQFLTFRLSIPGQSKPVTRTYSLSDSPHHPDYYRVSIKRLPAPENQQGLPPGLASSYFHDQVHPGAQLCVKAPRGNFYLDPSENTPVVLLSGGVGLTPMISMLNTIIESGSQRPVWFVHGTRDGSEQAMGDHLRRVAAENDNVHVHISYSNPQPEDLANPKFDNHGRVSVELLKQVLPPAAYDFYLCGPTPFMRSLYKGLLSWGVAETRINFEFFGPASALKAEAEPVGKRAAAQDNNEQWEVVFSTSGLTANWENSSETLLDFAEAKGLRPDFSCRTGICHTCMSKLVAGEVEYVTEPLDMPDPGCVLICCSRPKTNVVIEI